MQAFFCFILIFSSGKQKIILIINHHFVEYSDLKDHYPLLFIRVKSSLYILFLSKRNFRIVILDEP